MGFTFLDVAKAFGRAKQAVFLEFIDRSSVRGGSARYLGVGLILIPTRVLFFQ